MRIAAEVDRAAVVEALVWAKQGGFNAGTVHAVAHRLGLNAELTAALRDARPSKADVA